MFVSPFLATQLQALERVRTQRPDLAVCVPLVTVSEANAHVHWRGKAKRVANQRAVVGLALAPSRVLLRGRLRERDLVVLLRRVAPRALDSDNLASALKAARDAVAGVLGVDDRAPCVAWIVDQAKGKAALEIEVYAGGARE